MWSIRNWPQSLWPLSMSTLMVGSPCWACRASSVWMDEISAPNSRSPTSIASAAMPRNCRLVNPVSRVKVSWIATDSASLATNMSSNRWRRARTIQLLVWNAFSAQSPRGSFDNRP